MLSVMLLFSAQSPKKNHVLLALVMVFYTLPLIKTMLIDVGFYADGMHSFLPIELIYGLGPSLYLYVKAVSDPAYRIKPLEWLHFLPVILESIYYLSPAYQLVPFRAFTEVQNTHHLIWMIQQIGGFVSIIGYFGWSAWILNRYGHWVRNNYSDLHQKNLRWLKMPVYLYTAFFIIWFGLRGMDIVVFNDSLGVLSYYPFLAILTTITCWIGLKGFLHSQILAIGYSQASQKKRNEGDSEHQSSLRALFEHVEEVMKKQQLYLNNGLTLNELSRHTNISSRLLSQTINSQAKVNFYHYVNQYRLSMFKQKLLDTDRTKGIFELALDCGFNSKTTFNQIFKADTGMTPTDYKKHRLSSHD